MLSPDCTGSVRPTDFRSYECINVVPFAVLILHRQAKQQAKVLRINKYKDFLNEGARPVAQAIKGSYKVEMDSARPPYSHRNKFGYSMSLI